MQLDFHYYATYCAAYLAGYSHWDSLEICTAAQYVDCCTKTALQKMQAPLSAATTQSQPELIDSPTGVLTLQNFTRIWSSFHFLPRNLYADTGKRALMYNQKYRLICGPNGDLLSDTLHLAKQNATLQAAGIAMHILADTWAHQYFAGTPSMVINNVTDDVWEVFSDTDTPNRKVTFQHKITGSDNLEHSCYTCSLPQYNEHSVMNLGHGRIGHLPDYSFITYRYLPAWGDYQEIVKDNPSDYLHAFAQMIYAMRYLRGDVDVFETNTYAWDILEPVRPLVEAIIRKRQLNAQEDWKALGEQLSGFEIPAFSDKEYESLYLHAENDEKDDTPPGKFILAALSQKSMVTNRIFVSGSLMAGYSIDYRQKGFRGMKDFRKLVVEAKSRRRKL